MDKQWSMAVKYSLHLPTSFDIALILLDRARGGLGLEPAANFMLKEVQIHVKQCLQLGGEVSDLLRDATLDVMTMLGIQ